MIKTVNRHYIHVPLEVFGGLADVEGEIEKYSFLDVNDEKMVKEHIVRKSVLPYMRRIDPASIEKIKVALAYGLSDPHTRFERIYYSLLVPFDAPSDPRNLFVWLWEECFPGEDYKTDITQYQLNDDLEEPTYNVKVTPEIKDS